MNHSLNDAKGRPAARTTPVSALLATVTAVGAKSKTSLEIDLDPTTSWSVDGSPLRLVDINDAADSTAAVIDPPAAERP